MDWSAETMPSHPSSFFPCRVALAAAGNIGLAVARLLADSGNEPTAVWSRSQGSADRASDVLDVPVAPLEEVGADADVLLIGAPEGAIEEVGRGAAISLRPGTAVVHFAGSTGTAPLQPVTESGAVPMALHPMQTCPDVAVAVRRLPGSAWGVTCSDEARPWADDLIATQLHGTPVEVEERLRPVWHAAAATTANGISALLALAEAMLSAAHVGNASAVLAPLAAGAVANAVEEGGGAATLTGPVVRGDADSVARHIEALAELDVSSSQRYKDVAAMILATARAGGRVDPDRAAAIQRLIAR